MSVKELEIINIEDMPKPSKLFIEKITLPDGLFDQYENALKLICCPKCKGVILTILLKDNERRCVACGFCDELEEQA
jgi:hypothetical protein